MRSWGWLVVAAVLIAGCALPGHRSPPPCYCTQVVGGAPWTDLVVEIDHAPGHAPSQAALAHLLMTLRNVTGKSTVTLDVRETLDDTPGKAWTAPELLTLEAKTRRHPHAQPHALLHVLYPSGTYNSTDAAGVTISGTALGPAAIFLDKLREVHLPVGGLPALNQPPQGVETLERSTLLHEVGHAMGLVDNGLTMTRDHEDREKDPAKGGHSRNPQSVMYWAIDSTKALEQFLLNDKSVPDSFDTDDLADIRAGGGR